MDDPIVFCAGAIATIVGCVDVVRTYYAKPITTEYHIIPNETMILPSVHLCVQDHLMSTHEYKLGANFSDNLSTLLRHHIGAGSVPADVIAGVLQDDTMKAEYEELKNQLLVQDFLGILRQWAVKCEDVVLACGHLSGEQCCQNVSRYRTYIGTCFTFPPIKQVEAGMFRGFTLTMKVVNATIFLCPNQQFCGLCTGSKTYCTFRRANIQPPWTSLEVRLKIFEGLQEASENCSDIEHKDKYSEHVCSWGCILDSIAEMCGCNHLHFPQIYGSLDEEFQINCSLWDVVVCNDYFSNRQLLNHTMLKGIQKKCSKGPFIN